MYSLKIIAFLAIFFSLHLCEKLPKILSHDTISEINDKSRAELFQPKNNFTKNFFVNAKVPACSENVLSQYVSQTLVLLDIFKSRVYTVRRLTLSVRTCKVTLANSLIRIRQAKLFVYKLDFLKAQKKLKVVESPLKSCDGYLSSRKVFIPQINSTLKTLPVLYGNLSLSRTCIKNIPITSPPLSGQIPYDDLDIQSSPESIEISSNNFTLQFKNKDARIRTAQKFKKGVFSIDFRCPSSYGGLQIAFYLSSTLNGAFKDALMFEFIGDSTFRVRPTIWFKGRRLGMPTTQLPYNCSAAFHKYTIAWDSNTAIFLIDGEVVRILQRSNTLERRFFPFFSMYLFASIRRPASSGFGVFDIRKGPFKAAFRNFRFSPISLSSALVAPIFPTRPFPLNYFSIMFCRETTRYEKSILVLSYGEKACLGGNVRSPRRFNYGRFSALIKCAAGNTSGLVTSIYTSSFEGSPRIQDEIDFEFLGSSKKLVQTNFFVNGIGSNEMNIPLNFDVSDDFHNYTILWTPIKIEWHIDMKIVRTVFKANRTALGKGYPTKPSYLYASVWNANNRFWSGIYNGKDAPYFVQYKSIEVYSPPV